MTDWQLHPTATRRFTHTTGFQLHYSAKKNSWTAYIAHEHTEVWPHSDHRTYKNLTRNQVERLFRLAARYTMPMHFEQGIGMKSTTAILIWLYRKPVPHCMTPGCNMRISVPTYKHNHGEPYYCVNHRSNDQEYPA